MGRFRLFPQWGIESGRRGQVGVVAASIPCLERHRVPARCALFCEYHAGFQPALIREFSVCIPGSGQFTRPGNSDLSQPSGESGPRSKKTMNRIGLTIFVLAAWPVASSAGEGDEVDFVPVT